MYISKKYLTLFFTATVLTLLISCKEGKEQTKPVADKEAVPAKKVEEAPKNQKLTKEQQIAAAVMAAPEEMRAGAKVYGYDDAGNFITLREGTNEMVCLADDPNRAGFEVDCYHKDLDPYMARGRALKAEGKSAGERREIREKEAKAGTLPMPKKPATLHILHGTDGWFDTKTGEVKNAVYRYVVYIPFATQETTGLSLKPNGPGHPWLMYPGKANAHIMITPPAK